MTFTIKKDGVNLGDVTAIDVTKDFNVEDSGSSIAKISKKKYYSIVRIDTDFNSDTVISWEQEVSGNGDMWDISDPTKIIVPIAGFYYVFFVKNQGAHTSRGNAIIRKNGSDVSQRGEYGGSHILSTYFDEFSVNDEITFEHSNGGGRTVNWCLAGAILIKEL